MKRIPLFLLGLLGAAQLLSSCKKDYLDETPQSLYTPQTVLVDSLGFEAAMAGLQSVVREQYTASDRQGLLSTMQVGTDAAIPVLSAIESIEVPYYNYAIMNSQDGGAAYYWSWAYRTINNANQIIAGTTTAGPALRQGYKTRIAAEARFFRAYAYNFLVTLYGGVPLVDAPVTSPRLNFTRASVAELNTFIINDLTNAVASLPQVDQRPVSQQARINRGAAQQLLGEVYLRAGQPAQAEAQLQALIGGGKYRLISARYGVKATQPGDAFSDMFVIGNQRRSQGNTELIWGIEQQLLVPGGETSAQQRRVWVPGYYNIQGMLVADSLGGRGVGRLRLSDWVIYRLYRGGNDMRNSKYNLRRRFYYNNPTSSNFGRRVVVTGSDTLRIAPHTTKWNQYNPNDAFGFGTIKDLPMMRLGETYLLLAEAQLKQNKLTEAAASINVLRTRAQAAQVSAADITLDFILDERARELIGEEQRRLTLVRTGTLINRVTRLNPEFTTGLSTRNLLLPIPQTEINLNTGGVLEQNPGY